MDETGMRIESLGNSEYRVHVDSGEGDATLSVLLGDVDDMGDGRLRDDSSTARALITFLLRHQDVGDLPPRIELEDVLAAYTDAVEEIGSLHE